MRWSLNMAASFSVTLLSGCATIMGHSEYDISVDCNVPKARIEIYKEGEVVAEGFSPQKFTLPSKGGFYSPATYTIRFSKEGYESVEEQIQAKFNGWFIGNCIFLGYSFIGYLIVDPLTGAMFKFEDDASVYGFLRDINDCEREKVEMERREKSVRKEISGDRQYSDGELTMPFFPMMFIPLQ